MTLEQFCEEHSLEYPQDDRKFTIKAASFDEAALFYAMTPEEDQRLGCIGHVRMDFGHRGQEFWHTWWPRGPEELNSPEFKAELQEVVDELRTSILKDLAGMTKYCWGHGGEVGGWPANYGYIVETENYRYHCTEGYYSNIGEDGFTEKDHIRLRDALLSIQGKFLLSYNDDGFIRELYDAPGIQIEPVTRLNNIRQRYDPNCQFAELLIANYDLHERERSSIQLNLFDFDMKETDYEICKRNHFQGPPDPRGSHEALWL